MKNIFYKCKKFRKLCSSPLWKNFIKIPMGFERKSLNELSCKKKNKQMKWIIDFITSLLFPFLIGQGKNGFGKNQDKLR